MAHRKGAGRPRIIIDPVRVVFLLDSKTNKQLEDVCNDKNIVKSEAIRSLIRDGIKKLEKIDAQ